MMAGGCSGSLSTLSPSGPAAGSIATLWWVMLAGACVVVLPLLIVFLLFQRRFIEGIATTGIK